MKERIAILAGGGKLPLVLADSIVSRGGRAHIVGVRGEAGPEIEAYPHTWVTWGAVNTILTTLKRESNGVMMIAGSVSRPDLKRLKPDFGVIRYLPSVLAMLKGGDDAVLTRLIRFFEKQGLSVKGVADVAPQLLATAGVLASNAAVSETPVASEPRAEKTRDADAALGFAVLDALADLDVGQAVAVNQGRILAIEGVEGTDRMLTRIATLAARGEPGGVVIKGPKRGQDLRVDMPTVGAETIAGLSAAGIEELVIVAGKTLLLDRDRMSERAAQQNIVVRGVERVSNRADASVAGAETGRRRGTVVQQTKAGTLLGRLVPNADDSRDVRTAAEVTQRLVTFGTGRAAVVVRDHVLAVSATEGPLGLAQRMAKLRQWGHKRRGRGAAVLRFDAGRDDPAMIQAFIEALAGAGLAGVAIVHETSPATVAVPSVSLSAVRAADLQGLFLVEIDADGDRPPVVAAS